MFFWDDPFINNRWCDIIAKLSFWHISLTFYGQLIDIVLIFYNHLIDLKKSHEINHRLKLGMAKRRVVSSSGWDVILTKIAQPEHGPFNKRVMSTRSWHDPFIKQVTRHIPLKLNRSCSCQHAYNPFIVNSLKTWKIGVTTHLTRFSIFF